MNSIFEILLDNSIHSMLAAIEIYNKPYFKYREEVFAILNTNSWELLLKAKILKDNNNDIASLYVYHNDGKQKLSRSGNPMTIEILACIKRLALDKSVLENIQSIVEIRDTVTHLYFDSSLSYLVYTLGVASLKNYQKLIKEWFDRSLLEYNFYILPLAFAYDFRTLSILDLEEKPLAISNMIKSMSEIQSAQKEHDDYYFVCELATEMKSAKKFVGNADLTAIIDPNKAESTPFIIKDRFLIDKYSLSYTELAEKVQEVKPGAKRHHIDQLIKDYNIKNDSKYSVYNFRTKTQRDEYEKKQETLPKGVPSIYNHDAVRFVIENIDEYVDVK